MQQEDGQGAATINQPSLEDTLKAGSPEQSQKNYLTSFTRSGARKINSC
jgi:hypothetical protein